MYVGQAVRVEGEAEAFVIANLDDESNRVTVQDLNQAAMTISQDRIIEV